MRRTIAGPAEGTGAIHPATDARVRLDHCNVADLRELARRRNPRWLFEFIDRGCEDEVGLRNNRAAFERHEFLPRVLVDVSRRRQAVRIFGEPHPLPFLIAPTGIAGILRPHGDLDVARAARDAGIVYALAAASTTPLERVAREVGGRLWFQMNLWSDRGLSASLVDRVARCGAYEALVLTVDGAVGPNREHNRRNGFDVPFRFNPRIIADSLRHPGWLLGRFARGVLRDGFPRRENYPGTLRALMTSDPTSTRNDSLGWDDLRRLRDRWRGRLVVKGVLHPDDARAAVDCGADAVVVSNHGGRNLDGAAAPLDALPAVVHAVGTRASVLMDGGIRRGSDVVKALALGADAVLIGRAALYGIAAAGRPGAARAIDVLRQEIDRVLALLGCPDAGALDRSYLRDTLVPAPRAAPRSPVQLF